MDPFGVRRVSLPNGIRDGRGQVGQLFCGPALGIDEVARSEGRDGLFREVVTLIDHVEAVLWRRQDLPATHRQISQQQVMIDDDDRGLLHAFASLNLCAVAEGRAGAIQAAMAVGRDVLPDVIGDAFAHVAVTIPTALCEIGGHRFDILADGLGVGLLAGALFAAEHGDLLHVGDRLAKLVDTDIAGPALGQFDGAAKACRALEEGEVPGG